MKCLSVLALCAVVLGQQYPSETVAACGPAPTAGIPFSDAKLPDPFTFVNGTKVSSLNSWACRREELRSLFQAYEIGPKPPKPTVSATLSGNKLTVTCSVAGKSISFDVTIKPSSGSSPSPAIIAFGAASIPIPASVATITFNNDEIASTTSATHGIGKFYNLYGTSHPAGGLAAWAWGVSRIIDALEYLGSKQTGIDTTRIGVTGCSRNGKGAIFSGALDDRVALTIPQEAGSGGPGCWRIVQAQKDSGGAVETAAQIVTGDAWFSPSFTQWTTKLSQLPYDHHALMSLVAPRGLLVIENTSFEWLGDMSTFGCSQAAQKAYGAWRATGNAAIGYSQVGHPDHCGFPSSQKPELDVFINRFLLGQNTNTNIFKSDKTYNFQLEKWATWQVPSFS